MLTCPVVELCATRGEIAATLKPAPQKKREINYALHVRDDEVFLVQRPSDASLMAGMWELPELANENLARPLQNHSPAFTLRHSITLTDYTVRVWRNVELSHDGGKWFPVHRLPRVALTGLAQKILRKAEVL